MGQNQSPHPLGLLEQKLVLHCLPLTPHSPFRRHPCSEQDWGKLLSGQYLKVEEIRRKGDQWGNRGSDGRSTHEEVKQGLSAGLCRHRRSGARFRAVCPFQAPGTSHSTSPTGIWGAQILAPELSCWEFTRPQGWACWRQSGQCQVSLDKVRGMKEADRGTLAQRHGPCSRQSRCL